MVERANHNHLDRLCGYTELSRVKKLIARLLIDNPQTIISNDCLKNLWPSKTPTINSFHATMSYVRTFFADNKLGELHSVGNIGYVFYPQDQLPIPNFTPVAFMVE